MLSRVIIAVLGLWMLGVGCLNLPDVARVAPNGLTPNAEPIPIPTASSAPAALLISPSPVLRSPATDVPPTKPPATPTPSPSFTPAPTRLPTAAPTTRTTYEIEAVFSYQEGTLQVDQRLTYVNRGSSHLDKLPLLVEPNRLANAFELEVASWGDGSPIDSLVFDGPHLSVPLQPSLAPGESVTLDLVYRLTLPWINGPFGRSARQANFGDWYPFVPAQGSDGGWLIHRPHFLGEHLVSEVADFYVAISVTDDEVAPVIAAPGTRYQDENRYQYELTAARGFAWSASPEYETLRLNDGRVVFESYTFPENRAAAQQVLETNRAMAALLSQTISPYDKPTLITVPALFHDGKEYHGLFFLDNELYENYRGSPRGYLTAIAAHETAHQWWAGSVGTDPALEPWIDESLATYSELLFYEEVYPDDVAWWWETRVNRFSPSGPLDVPIYDFADFRTYVDQVYLNGVHFWDRVRTTIGDAQFQALLGRIGKNHQYQILSAEALLEDLAPALNKDPTIYPTFFSK